MKTDVEMIAAERLRQVEEEGWTPEHDAQQAEGELEMAAACYAMPPEARGSKVVPLGEVERWRPAGSGV